ncbi:MAG: T9SS type A sorting domain-containing protein, partial [Cytophagales bacterium]|nr:T9SS type A sorting domain-containing protein [Cytophagales bacterium]
GLITFPCAGTGLQTITVSIPGAGVTIPKASSTYSIRYYSPLEAILNVYKGGTSFAYPRNYNNILQTTGYNHTNSSIAIFGHPALYDWGITAAPACARTPLRAIPCNSLELNWISVWVNSKGNRNIIEWSAHEDHQVAYYEVEKSSDGIYFSVLTHSKTYAKGNETAHYSIQDPTTQSPATYYRIRGYDLDGKTYISKIVLANPSSQELDIVPNPSNSPTPIYLKTDTNKDYQLTIYQIDGSKIYSTTLPAGTIQLPYVETLPAGVYVLGFLSEDGVVFRKCVRE